jgi:hypothetical protein
MKLFCSGRLVPLCLPVCLLSSHAAAEAESKVLLRQHGDWWWGMDTGVGALDLDLPAGSIEENRFYLGVRVEYILQPNILLGIEANGWLIQSGEIEYNTKPPPLNYESQLEGEGLAPVLLTARYYPGNDASGYLKAGAGYASHWKTQQGVTGREGGAGFMFGAGYDFVINESWDITTVLSYSSGNAGDENYDAVTLSVGFNYKIRRR